MPGAAGSSDRQGGPADDRLLLGNYNNNLGLLLRELDRPGEAEPYGRCAVELADGLVKESPAVPRYREHLARALNNHGANLASVGRRPEAGPVFRRAAETWEGLAAESPGVAQYRHEHALGLVNLAMLQERMGRPDEAIPLYERAATLQRALAADAPGVPAYRQMQSVASDMLATLLINKPAPDPRDVARATGMARESIRLDPRSAGSWRVLGRALHRGGDHAGAVAALEKAVEFGSGGEPSDWLLLAQGLARTAKGDEARRWYDKAAAWIERNKTQDRALLRLRDEAATLLGETVPTKDETREEGISAPK